MHKIDHLNHFTEYSSRHWVHTFIVLCSLPSSRTFHHPVPKPHSQWQSLPILPTSSLWQTQTSFLSPLIYLNSSTPSMQSASWVWSLHSMGNASEIHLLFQQLLLRFPSGAPLSITCLLLHLLKDVWSVSRSGRSPVMLSLELITTGPSLLPQWSFVSFFLGHSRWS